MERDHPDKVEVAVKQVVDPAADVWAATDRVPDPPVTASAPNAAQRNLTSRGCHAMK
jgi:hypothetical protein